MQSRYELVRLVKYEKVAIDKAISIYGFKSRSSYYQFSKQIREQGFMGLLDLRPYYRQINEEKYEDNKRVNEHITQVYHYEELNSFLVRT